VPLATDDIWINVEPRILEIKHLKWDATEEASAQMEKEHLPYFAGLLGENRFSTTKARCAENMVITDKIIRKHKPKSTWDNLTEKDIQALIDEVSGEKRKGEGSGGNAMELDRK